MRFLFLLLFLTSCASKSKKTTEEIGKFENEKSYKYDLKQKRCIEFRRNYFSDPATEKNDKLMYAFMNRNPERGYANDTILKKYENGFTKLNVLDTAGNLNLKTWQKISKEKIKSIKISGDKYQLNIGEPTNGNYLEIADVNKSIIASINYEVSFSPAVSFYVYDLNADGVDEIIVLDSWYIINGDNYDFSIIEIIEN